KSPAHQGEHEAAVKTIVQGMPGCSGLTCGDCRLLSLLQAGHGCGLHPAFPAPFALSRVMSGKTRAHRVARMRSCVFVIARSASDEAIHCLLVGTMDCFASLAMTM